MHPEWRCVVYTLCRARDPDRAPKFQKALSEMGASGRMADLDDGPEQRPLSGTEVRQAILDLVGMKDFDLLITHHPNGEYTRHRRHEETGRAGLSLWAKGKMRAKRLWVFAYEDGQKAYYPRAAKGADIRFALPDAVWKEKYRIMTEVYGFKSNSWEAQTAPGVEAFWCLESPQGIPKAFQTEDLEA